MIAQYGHERIKGAEYAAFLVNLPSSYVHALRNLTMMIDKLLILQLGAHPECGDSRIPIKSGNAIVGRKCEYR